MKVNDVVQDEVVTVTQLPFEDWSASTQEDLFAEFGFDVNSSMRLRGASLVLNIQPCINFANTVLHCILSCCSPHERDRHVGGVDVDARQLLVARRVVILLENNIMLTQSLVV